MKAATEELRLAHDPAALSEFLDRMLNGGLAAASEEDLQVLLLVASELVVPAGADRRALQALAAVVRHRPGDAWLSVARAVALQSRATLLVSRLLQLPAAHRFTGAAELIACLHAGHPAEQRGMQRLLLDHAAGTAADTSSPHPLALEALYAIAVQTRDFALVAPFTTVTTLLQTPSLVRSVAQAAAAADAAARSLYSALAAKLQRVDGLLLAEAKASVDTCDRFLLGQAMLLRCAHELPTLAASTPASAALLTAMCELLEARPESSKALPALPVPLSLMLPPLATARADRRKCSLLRLLLGALRAYGSSSNPSNSSSSEDLDGHSGTIAAAAATTATPLSAEVATAVFHACVAVVDATMQTFVQNEIDSDLRTLALQCAAAVAGLTIPTGAAHDGTATTMTTAPAIQWGQVRCKVWKSPVPQCETAAAVFFAELFASDIAMGTTVSLAHAHLELLRALTHGRTHEACALRVWHQVLCGYAIPVASVVRSMLSFVLQRLPAHVAPSYAHQCVQALQRSTVGTGTGRTRSHTSSTSSTPHETREPLLAADAACERASTLALLAYYGQAVERCTAWPVLAALCDGALPLAARLKDARALSLTRDLCRCTAELWREGDAAVTAAPATEDASAAGSESAAAAAVSCGTVARILEATNELTGLVELTLLPVCGKALRQMEKLRLAVTPSLTSLVARVGSAAESLQRTVARLVPADAALSDVDSEPSDGGAGGDASAGAKRKQHQARMRALATGKRAKPNAAGATTATDEDGAGLTPTKKQQPPSHRTKKKHRVRSRNPFIDAFLREEDGGDNYADLEDFIDATPGHVYV